MISGRSRERDFGIITDPETGLSQPVSSERGHYLAFYDQLYESLTQQRAAPVTAGEALRSIRLIELALCQFAYRQRSANLMDLTLSCRISTTLLSSRCRTR